MIQDLAPGHKHQGQLVLEALLTSSDQGTTGRSSVGKAGGADPAVDETVLARNKANEGLLRLAEAGVAEIVATAVGIAVAFVGEGADRALLAS